MLNAVLVEYDRGLPHAYLGYPNNPGYQAQETSRQAALEIAPKAKQIRNLVLKALQNHAMGATPDTIAEELRLSILSVRPRFTELKLKGKIADSGRRGKTDSGKSSIVWIAI